mgnify:CR=1 FL=1
MSTTLDAILHWLSLWISVMVVKLNSCLTFNKISRPSSIPIPLCEDNEVLFALSKDDLKINCILSLSQIFLILSA